MERRNTVLNKFLKLYSEHDIVKPIIPFILILIAGVVVSPYNFTSPENIRVVLLQASPIALLAVGEGMVIIMGSIDLTPGSVAGFTSMLAGIVVASTGNALLAAFVAIGVGALIGLLNGVLVTKLKIYSFIATLAGLEIWRAITLSITGGSPIFGLKQFSLLAVALGPIPMVFIISLLLTALMWYLATNTTYGRLVYGLGSNEEAIRLAGARADAVKIVTFTIAGALYGTAGALLIPVSGYAVDPWTAYGYELTAIAAAVIGGISLSGGSGNVFGPFIGALVLTILTNILIIFGISQYTIMEIIIGIILIAAAPALTRGLKWVK